MSTKHTAPPGPDSDREELRRVGRRRLWRLIAVLAAISIIGALVAAAYFSPVLSVRSMEVSGAAVVAESGQESGAGQQPIAGVTIARDEILALADVPFGTPLLQVDTAAVAARVARIPALESVRVDRRYPSTLAITVTERTPRVLLDVGDGRIGVMDSVGVVYVEFASRGALESSTARDGKFRNLPMLQVSNPGPEDPTTQSALEVAASLPEWLRPQVETISASSPADVTLLLTKGRTVVWGGSDRGADKAEALRHVLKLPGTTYNVSSPDYPAIS
ncbi:MAG: FtsQ-type POTRA domain-containing protein [Gordonia sp. (in: high G+C Gram-positive bacteria)]|uniref:cell division protein FtsQ/DivIB n=1 Tax=Gordonia sp. (in: high G+C Gram-positive bacteria) TaxID=84139 RepID=UPI003BB7903C